MVEITVNTAQQNPNAVYSYLLPLSYMIPTFYPTLPGTPVAQGGAPAINLADPDLQARAQRLANVLFWTAETFKDQDGMADANTLKVFIAPEFYFRKASDPEALAGQFTRNTSFGSYPEDIRYPLAEVLYGAIQASPLFKNWLIIAGTVCTVLPDAPPGRLDLLNTSIMIRGQRAFSDAAAPYILMEKHYISHIDGPPQDWHANTDPTTVYSFRLNPDQNLDNIIFWDEMTVGLEVCLDHDMQVVANAMNLIQQSLGPKVQPLDLQLITSCGMSIVSQAVAVENGALVMLTDGYSSLFNNFGEPQFEVGRYHAGTRSVAIKPREEFQFEALPSSTDYSVNYAQGQYSSRGGRQGVWASKHRISLNQ